MSALTRKLRHAMWVLNGYVGRTVSVDIPQKVTVLITYYHPSRMEHINPQLRNILKCNFVDKLVVSNHNPDINIEEKVKIKDRRLHFINQLVRRDCGYRWIVAHELNPEYLIVVDDDILFFPKQLARLFKRLIAEPVIPHGITGMIHLENRVLEYHEKKNMEVDFLCETYAVTGVHVSRYMELRRLVGTNEGVTEMIDAVADFILISRSGSRDPQIHNVGRLFKSDTFKQAGVAVHKTEGFDNAVQEVVQQLNTLEVHGGHKPGIVTA